MNRIQKLFTIFTACSFCMVTGCSDSVKTTETDQEKAETETVSIIPEDWKEIEAEGISMKVPQEIADFVSYEGNEGYYIAVDEDAYSFILLTASEPDADITASELTQQDLEDIVLDSYTSFEVSDFSNEVLLSDEVPAVYIRGIADPGDGSDKQELVLYMILPEDNSFQLMEAIVVQGAETELEDHIDAWMASLEITGEADTTSNTDTSTSTVSSVFSTIGQKSAASSASSSASSSTSDNQVENSGYTAYNSFFYVKIPESWKDTIVLEDWASEDGDRYYFALHEPTSYEALPDGGLLVTIAILPVSYDYTTDPDYEFLGQIDLAGDRSEMYNVVAFYPTDAGFNPDTEEAYRQWNSQIPYVVASLDAMEGYTFYPDNSK